MSAKKSFKPESLVPVLPMWPYQQRFIDDPARLIGWVKARQIGGSVGGTLKMVVSAISGGEDWNTMSRTGRQAKKLLRKAAKHVEAIDFFLRTRLNQSTIIDKISTEEIVFKSGVTIAALPCDADTTVGDTINWFFDEWALYPDSERIFAMLKPSISHGKRLMGCSTPRGRHNKFAELYQLWQQHGKASEWSWHVTTIEQAYEGGLRLRDHLGRVLTLEEFKKGEVRDMGLEMWNQEYMCIFQDLLTAFLTWEMIQRCEVDGPLVRTPEQLAQLVNQGAELYGGIDIGRRKDLTVFWIVQKLPDASYRTVCVKVLDRTPFAQQQIVFQDYLRVGLIRCCIDQMGIGMQLAETLQQEFGGVVEPVTFTNASKLMMAERLRVQMESGQFTFPQDPEDEIAEDFASIERIVTEQNNVRLAAAPGNRTHGDYFWAAAQAIRAANDYGPASVAMSAA